MTISITGIGTAVPEHSISQTGAYEATQQLCCESDEQRRVMGLIYEGAGVHTRGTVLLQETNGVSNLENNFFWQREDLDDRGPTTGARMEKYEAYALELGLESSRAALQEAGVHVSEITHLVTVSCSGFCAPGVDVGLIQALGLSPETSRTNVGFMGCHGSFNALRVAKSYVEADPSAVVLLCSTELCSLHHHYGWSTEKVIANALFGDGSAAVICRAATSQTTASPSQYKLIRNGTHLLPGSTKAMTWRIRDHGFEMTLSQKVPSLIEQNLRPWMEGFLAKEGLTIADVKNWAIHPGGPRILDACVNALGIPPESVALSREILSKYSNMSSATILFLLDRVQEAAERGPVVALGFGPGLTIEAMILTSGI
jgi:alkylresorcinol/alkylpyrone synthase